jgi:gliding motility-associated-like protein
MDCPEIIVPSAFSPNGDKKNDYFFILDKKFTKLNYFQVFNRWGEMVYSTDDINALGWDGSLNGKEQAEGVFTYKIMATDSNGNIKILNGNVTLVK